MALDEEEVEELYAKIRIRTRNLLSTKKKSCHYITEDCRKILIILILINIFLVVLYTTTEIFPKYDYVKIS